MKNKINIVGIGPGNINQITPDALDIIKSSDMIIGGKRNLEIIRYFNLCTMQITSNLDEMIKYINNNYNKKKITIIVSGDPGFYSLLDFIKKHINKDIINVIPGISSVQYMFAKLKENWYDSEFITCHGRDLNIQILKNKISENNKIVILTDSNNSPQKIAILLSKNNVTGKKIIIGANLSYKNELIKEYDIQSLVNEKKDLNFSIMVIVNE